MADAIMKRKKSPIEELDENKWTKKSSSSSKSSSSNSSSAREMDKKQFNQSSSSSSKSSSSSSKKSSSSSSKKSSSSSSSKSSSSSSKKSGSSSSGKSSSSSKSGSSSSKKSSSSESSRSERRGSSESSEKKGSSFYDDYLERKEEQEKSHDLFGGLVKSPFKKTDRFTPYSEREESEKRFTLPSVEKKVSAFSGNGGKQKTTEKQSGSAMTDIDIALAVNHSEASGKYGMPTARRTFKANPDMNFEGKRLPRTRKFLRQANNIVEGRVLGGLERAMSYGLTVTDEFQKGMIAHSEKAGLERLKKVGFNKDIINDIAENTAKYRTFQDNTLPAQILNGLKQTFNVVGIGDKVNYEIAGHEISVHEFGLGDIIQKYTTVPGNLISRSVEYSPLGYAKAFAHMVGAAKGKIKSGTKMSASTQRNIALSLARPMTGTGLIALFYMLSQTGILTGEREDEEKELKNMHDAEGVQSTQLNLSAFNRWVTSGFKDSDGRKNGDILETIGFLEPLNTLMAMGAGINEAEGNVLNPKSWASVVGAKTFDQILDMSTMQTMKNIFDTISYGGSIPDALIAVATSGVTGFIPSVVKQTGDMLDDTVRYPYKEKDKLTQATERVKSSIPLLRNDVAAKITPFGEERKNNTGNLVLDIFNNYLNPGYTNIYQTTDISEELYKYAEYDTDVLPRTPKKFQYKGVSYDPKGKDYERYSRMVGQYTLNNYRELIGSDEYKNMTDEEKTAALAAASKAGEQQAKVEYATGESTETAEQPTAATEQPTGGLFSNLLNKGKETPNPTEQPEEATAAPENTAVPKPSFTQKPAATSAPAATPNPNAERDNRVNTNIQTIADNLARAVPEKANEYSADKLKINRVDRVKIGDTSYDIPDDVEQKIVADANEEYYSNLDKLMSGEANIEDVLGYKSNGNPRTKEAIGGGSVEMTGKLYDENGNPRFDDYVMGKIYYDIKENAKKNAASKYQSEITGESADSGEGTQVSSSGGLPFETSAEAAEVPERQVGESIVETAKQYVGTPYVWGDESESGWDCSGYVINMFDKFGIHIPERTTEDQWASDTGVRITNQADLQPGDCLYFENSSGDVHHVAIYMGDGMMVHAKGRAYGTVTESFANSDHYQSEFVGAKRYYTAGDSTVASRSSSNGTKFRARSSSSGSSESSRSSGSSRSSRSSGSSRSSARFRARESAASSDNTSYFGFNDYDDFRDSVEAEYGIRPSGTHRSSLSTPSGSVSANTAAASGGSGLFSNIGSGGVTGFLGSSRLPSRMNGTQLRKTAAAKLFRNLMPWGNR